MKISSISKLRTNARSLSLFTFLLAGISNPLLAQQPEGAIEGKTTDSTGKILDYVTVTLINLPDSSIVKAILTNEEGNYNFNQLKNGSYFVKAELLGYNQTNSPTVKISTNHKTVKLEDLQLATSNKELETIVITSQKPLFERKADMMVVNVENSSLSAGNNAMDILERSPGIAVDKDDNISLNGKKGVMVMVDGKQTHLSSSQLASLLRSTDGNTIQSLEIIDSPSAKYDASGASGIINIKLKKNKLAGTNGTFNLGGGYGNGRKGNTSLNLNHKSGKIGIFGTYSYQENDRTDFMNINRIVGGGTEFTSFDQDNSMNSQRNNHSLRTGIDYQISEKNTLSLQVSGLLNNSNDKNSSDVLMGSFQSSLDSTMIANSFFDSDFKSYSVNLSNTYQIDTMGSKISADIDLSSFQDNLLADYENFFYNPDGSSPHIPLILRSDMPSRIKIQSYKADFTHPFNENSGMEAGLKFANVKTDNNLKFSEWIENTWSNVANRSNHFIYTEQVAAAYLNYNKKIKKFSLQTGLRTEYTISNGNSVTLDNQVKRDYIDFFPNISIAYEKSDSHQFSLSYSKRINRPQYDNLNPFNYFLDKYTYQQGNPYLEPEYNHAFKLNYTFLKRFNFTTGYEVTNNAVVEIMRQNDIEKTTLVTNENIAKQQQWFLNINAPFKFTKFWSSNTNVTGFYLGFISDSPEDAIDFGQYALQLNSNQTFQITPSFSADATVNYQSGLQYSIYKIGHSWSTDVGISKSFNNKRTNLKLSVSDIFNTRTQNVSTQYANLNTRIYQKRETQVFRLSFSYSFGNTKIGEAKQSSKSEEQQRVGK